jgi:hypothetical protein
MASDMFYLIKDIGFPIVVAILLIYDKLKTQDRLITVIENNNALLTVIKLYLGKLAKK